MRRLALGSSSLAALVLSSVFVLSAVLALLIATASAPSDRGATTTRLGPGRVAPLQLAEHQLSGWSYSLDTLASCEVGDGVAVVRDGSSAPIRITAVRVVTAGAGASRLRPWTFELMEFPRGATTGALAGDVALAPLRNGRSLGPAVGRTLSSIRTSGLWYDIVAKLRAPGGDAGASEIRGLDVTYVLGARTHTARLQQSIHLPAFDRCG